MFLWTKYIVLMLSIVLEVSAGKWKKNLDFDSLDVREMVRQGFAIYCKDCNTLEYQIGAMTPTTLECPSEQLCGPADGAFSCIPADDPDASECSCGGAENIFIPDPYNPAIYYVCLPGGEQVFQDCGTDVYTGDHTDPCLTVPTCGAADAQIGFNNIEDSCTRSYFCESDSATAVISNCEDGFIWDKVNFGCVDPCSLAPETFTCDGKEDGAHPDPIDCSIFHLCFLGTHIQQIECPDDNQYFDTKTSSCTNTDPGNCPSTDECYEEYKDTCHSTTVISTPSPDTTDATTGSDTTYATTGYDTTDATTTQSSESSTTGEKSTTETTLDTSTITETTDTTVTESTTSCIPPDTFTCDGKEDGAHPDPIDCSKLQLCFLGNHIEERCPDNLPFFDSATRSCVATDPGTCPKPCTASSVSTTDSTESSTDTTESSTDTTESSTDSTESTADTTESSTDSTMSSVDSTESSTVSSQSPTDTTESSTYFSESSTDTTESSTDSTTTITTTEKPLCSKTTEGEYFINADYSNKFFICESDENGGFVLKEYSCPGDLVYDPFNQYCNLPHLVPSIPPSSSDPTPYSTPDSTPDLNDSTADSTIVTGSPDCDQVTSQSYFPSSKETCNKFYTCESDDNGGFELKEYSCPGDLVFDPVNKYCNLLNLVPFCQ